MLYTLIVFFLTFIEIVTVAVGYLMHSQLIFGSAVFYGSPIYLIMHLVSADSGFFEKNPIIIGFAVFHVIKYFCFFRAEVLEDTSIWRKGAVFMEAAYLGISAYYLF